jgi:tRNA threonylcarbamoyladenosine biosynthesis protein TsaB
LIAVDIGPGAFTSVRVACGIAQGLALGWDCEVYAVQSLTAMAQQARALDTAPRSVACILDARMNECYVAHYQILADGVAQTLAPALVAYSQVAHLKVDTVIGNAHTVLPQWTNLAANVYDAAPTAQGVLDQVLYAFDAFFAPTPLALLQPLYVRNQVALTALQRAAGMVL